MSTELLSSPPPALRIAHHACFRRGRVPRCRRPPWLRAADLRYRESRPLLVQICTHTSVVNSQYQTTWDRAQLFTYTNLGSSPINFGTPGAIGQADIVVDDTAGFQSVWGHGGSLSKSLIVVISGMS